MAPTTPSPNQIQQNPMRSFREKIILKEMDAIRETVKNLDDIIYKTKNFAFLTWGGSLVLLVKFITEKQEEAPYTHWLILLSGVIPIMFWAMDYWWRKHLRMVSSRERRLSLFLNSDKLEDHLNGHHSEGKFPYYDHIGWIYTEQKLKAKKIPQEFLKEYLSNEKEFSIRKILFYKDA